jgi:hypothetical protein
MLHSAKVTEAIMILCKQKIGQERMPIYYMCMCRRKEFVYTVPGPLYKIATRDQTLKSNNLEIIVA